jgi:hypothetical protein
MYIMYVVYLFTTPSPLPPPRLPSPHSLPPPFPFPFLPPCPPLPPPISPHASTTPAVRPFRVRSHRRGAPPHQVGHLPSEMSNRRAPPGQPGASETGKLRGAYRPVPVPPHLREELLEARDTRGRSQPGTFLTLTCCHRKGRGVTQLIFLHAVWSCPEILGE